MTRAPMQVLALPFVVDDAGTVTYAVLHRSDVHAWQGVAGGAEDGETPAEAARRECAEELGTDAFNLIELASVSSIPAVNFIEWSTWRERSPSLLVVPEHTFGVRLRNRRRPIVRRTP